MIPFNKPFITGQEMDNISDAIAGGKIAGNGPFTKRCQQFFEERCGFTKCLLTASGTDALEMAAMLANIRPGDEVIVPSYTFVSTALAFVRQGAVIIFADSCRDNPNLDAERVEALITPRTRVIVPVHYAGVACDMSRIMTLAKKHDLLVVEDAAHAVDAYFTGELPTEKYPWHSRLHRVGNGYPLGGIGHLGCFSFHETKNVHCGEGGMLAINDPRLVQRAEIVWEKGTNRAEYLRGEVSKYEWVDVGSSFLPSGISAAFLLAQLESLQRIQDKRLTLWQNYQAGLGTLAEQGRFSLPQRPPYATNNAHMFYLVCGSKAERVGLMDALAADGIQTATHYQSLHDSIYYKPQYVGPELVNCKRFVDCLVRLPMYYELERNQVDYIVAKIKRFYGSHI